MHRSQRPLLVAILVVVASLVASGAHARPGPGARARVRPTQPRPGAFSSFKQFAREMQFPTALHRGRLFINVNDFSKLAMNAEAYTAIGGGKMLEFNGRGHLHTRYNGAKDAHYLFGSLYADGGYTPPRPKAVSVAVKLKDVEHRELNAYIEAARRNPQQEIGGWNYGGGRPKRYYPRENATANCTSWISAAKLGERGESLAKLAGVWESVSPSSWIGSLARNGNERVDAVLLHGFQGDMNNWREIDSFIGEALAH